MPVQRRQSIAASSASAKPRPGVGRKRAHSLAAPRKSILKPSIPQSGEIQHEVQAELNRTISRRVSFAPNAYCRVFEGNEQNTNSSGAPSSSPPPSSPPQHSPSSSVAPQAPQLSNENDYPGRHTIPPSRRASMGTEYGEASMDLDDDTDMSIWNLGNKGKVIAPNSAENSFDEDSYEEDGDGSDMDLTEAIVNNIHRKRSLSVSGGQAMSRRSSTASNRRMSTKFILPVEKGSDEDVDGEDVDSTTTSQMTQESEVPMEFTIPLEQALKEPKPPSDAWLALQAVTHSQTEGVDGEEDMDLTNALSRLQKARASFDFGQSANNQGTDDVQSEEPSFSSNDSSMDGTDMGDHTVNVTSLLGNVRNLEISEDSEGDGESGTIEDEDFVKPIASILPAPSVPTRPTLNVFSAPTSAQPANSAALLQPSLALPSPKVTVGAGTRGPPSPTKAKPQGESSSMKPNQFSVFSAITLSGSESSAKTSLVKAGPILTSASPATKRTATSQEDTISDAAKPSPAKKRAFETSATPLKQSRIPNRGDMASEPRAVASDSTAGGASSMASSTTKTGTGMRRPSGYFAQRRSLAPGALNSLGASSAQQNTAGAVLGRSPGRSQLSPNKLTMRRASIAVAPAKGLVQDENRFSTPSLNRIPNSFKDKQEVKMKVDVIDASDPEYIQDVPEAEGNLMSHRSPEVVAKVPLVAEEEFDDDVPPISIDDFFKMTGVKFMDEMTIPRRSTIHPSQLKGNRRDSGLLPTMSEFVTAMNVYIPQLELYSWVAKDLQTWIDNSKKIYNEAENEVAKVTPGLFREFSQANEDGRAELLHQLKLIKANKHSAAKEKWYEWKYQWIENLHEMADKGFTELEADRNALNSIINEAQDLLPALRQQHEQILLELEKERTEVTALEQSDPEYLEELKIAIDEQNQLLEVYRADVAEGNAKIERLDEKLSELDAQRQESIQAIEDAERKITLHKNSTRAEVFRLKDELESLQVLHSWRLVKVSHNALELIYEDQFLVMLPCTKYRPMTSETIITRIEEPQTKKRRDPFPLFSDVVVGRAQEFARKLSIDSTKSLLEALSDFWTSCTQIRTQLTFLSIKYPLSLEPLPSYGAEGCSGFKAVASVLLHSCKAKAYVFFFFGENMLAHWPFALRSLQCEVKIAYGSVTSEEIRETVMERLSEATVEDNHACLLDACVEAASKYEV